MSRTFLFIKLLNMNSPMKFGIAILKTKVSAIKTMDCKSATLDNAIVIA